MTRGATWTPAYDIRVDADTDSMSCTYYGRVAQSTTEDWEGRPLVALGVYRCHVFLSTTVVGFTDYQIRLQNP